MHTAAVVALFALVPVAGVVAFETEDPGFDAIVRAVSFSPWGAVILWIAWQVKRGVLRLGDIVSEKWAEAHDLVGDYVQTNKDLIRAIRETRLSGRDAPPYRAEVVDDMAATTPSRRAPRPRTNPANTLRGHDE